MRPGDLLRAGTPTGIGSLPYADVDTAVATELDLHPELPAAPQLPRRSALESMLAQVATGMPGVEVAEDGTLEVDRRRLAPVEHGAPLDEDAWGATLAFLDACATRSAPLKLQLTGPVTLGAALVRGGARAARAFTVAGATVRSRLAALLDEAARRCPAAPVVAVLDEPALVASGHPEFPLGSEETIDVLSGGLASATSAGAALAGIHACAPVDWSLALHAGPDIVSVPASADLALDAPSLALFLERGGWIAWGVVPTNEPLASRDAPYWRRLHETWAALAAAGCDPVQLRTQTLLTPTCGLALHDPVQVPAVMGLVRRVAERVQDQALAVRMSAGA